MRKKISILLSLGIFLAGLGTGWVASGKKLVPADFEGSENEVANRLLAKAQGFAGGGSWERIAVGDIYLRSGQEAEAEKLFNRALSNADANEYIRLGRSYFQNGNWEKAKFYLDKVVELEPKDEDWLAEVGAYYNLSGDREKAEELFRKSVKYDSNNLYNTLMMAGSYLGLSPNIK